MHTHSHIKNFHIITIDIRKETNCGATRFGEKKSLPCQPFQRQTILCPEYILSQLLPKPNSFEEFRTHCTFLYCQLSNMHAQLLIYEEVMDNGSNDGKEAVVIQIHNYLRNCFALILITVTFWLIEDHVKTILQSFVRWSSPSTAWTTCHHFSFRQ